MSDWSLFPEITPAPSDSPAPTRITVNKAPIEAPPQDIRPQFQPLDQRSRDLAIRTVFGEASAEPEDGQAAVAHVIRNRTMAGRYGGKDVPSVVLARNQFEPWSRADARARMLALKPGSPEYERLGAMVDAVFTGQHDDPTGGSTHFYSPKVQAALGRQAPSWGRQGQTVAIGGHQFFAPEGRVSLAGQSRPGEDLPANAQPAAAVTPPEPASPQPAAGGGWDQFPELTPNKGILDMPLADVSQGRAAFEGALSGATGNFRDELYGVSAASGLPEILGGFRAPVGAVRLAIETARGQPGPAYEAWREGTQRIRGTQTEAARQFPGTTLASEVGGAIVSPLSRIGAAAKGAKLTARALAALRQGALYGAVSGAGRGETGEERLTGAASEGATGAVLGPLATGALAAAGLGARKTVAALGYGGRKLVNPDAEAARQIVRAGQQDADAGARGLTPQQVAATPEAIVADMGGGKATAKLTRAAYDTSPEAKTGLDVVAQGRFDTQSPRLSTWLRETFDNPDLLAKQEAVKAASKIENNKNYVDAYRKGTAGIWNDELGVLWEAPIMRKAIDDAAGNAVNRMVGRGTGALQSPSGTPTLEMWDLVQRELRSKMNVAYRSGDTELGGTIKAVRDRLNEQLDKAVPEFQVARQGAFKWVGAENALDAGEKFVNVNLKDARKLAEARANLAKIGPADRAAFETGFVANLIAKVEANPDNRNLVIHQMFKSGPARQQIELAIGPQRARELEARLQVERVMQVTKEAIGGSQTSGNLAGQVLRGIGGYGAGGGIGFVTGQLSGLDPTPGNALSLGLGFAARRANVALNQRVLDRVGQMLLSRDPAVLERASRAIARNDKLLQVFRSFEAPTASVAAQQAPSTGLPQKMQTMAPGRADEDQPQAPGPRYQ